MLLHERLFLLLGSVPRLSCSQCKSFLQVFWSQLERLFWSWLLAGTHESTPELLLSEHVSEFAVWRFWPSLTWTLSWMLPFKYLHWVFTLSGDATSIWEPGASLPVTACPEVEVMQLDDTVCGTALGLFGTSAWDASVSSLLWLTASIFLLRRLFSSFSLSSFSFLCNPSALSFSSSTRLSSASWSLRLSSSCWRQIFSSFCSCSKSFTVWKTVKGKVKSKKKNACSCFQVTATQRQQYGKKIKSNKQNHPKIKWCFLLKGKKNQN